MYAKSYKQRKGEKIMATNWTLSQALVKITEGTDKAAIQDIGRRFPLTAVALAEIGQNAGAVKIIGAVPSYITARKIESVLKDGVEQDSDVDVEDVEDEAPKNEAKKPAKKTAKAKAEEDAEDTDDEEDDPVALYKKCKKAGLKVAPKKSAKYYKDQLAKAAAAEEDADDDWDDEEEDEKPAPKKKPAKKSAKKAEPEPEDDDEDDDEWDI